MFVRASQKSKTSSIKPTQRYHKQNKKVATFKKTNQEKSTQGGEKEK
jgi:hypothetical protein